MKGAIIIARKYKFVKEKKIAFDLDEWEIVKRRAAECNTNTTAFIRHMAVREPALFYDAKELAPLFNGMRIISHNINQVATILTKEVSRFARNTVDTLTYTRKLSELGVNVILRQGRRASLVDNVLDSSGGIP